MTAALEQRSGSFEPRRVDDLVPAALEWIHRTLRWQAVFVIEEGEYAGEWAWAPLATNAPFAWVPARDVSFL
jgi:hypothetical protein